ncbi:MAG: hypothetical protein ACXU8R_18120, partial [Xanthobacteraceae bacterium]
NVWQPGAPQPVHRAVEEDEALEQPDAERVEAVRAPPLRGPDDGERTGISESAKPDVPAAFAPAAGGLTRADAQKLQAALRDLTECRRLLDAALAEKV